MSDLMHTIVDIIESVVFALIMLGAVGLFVLYVRHILTFL